MLKDNLSILQVLSERYWVIESWIEVHGRAGGGYLLFAKTKMTLIYEVQNWSIIRPIVSHSSQTRKNLTIHYHNFCVVSVDAMFVRLKCLSYQEQLRASREDKSLHVFFARAD